MNHFLHISHTVTIQTMYCPEGGGGGEVSHFTEYKFGFESINCHTHLNSVTNICVETWRLLYIHLAKHVQIRQKNRKYFLKLKR